MNKMLRFLGCTASCVAILLVPAVASGPAQPTKPENPADAQARRVVAAGDVHGAYPEFVSILQRTGLMDSHLNWSGFWSGRQQGLPQATPEGGAGTPP